MNEKAVSADNEVLISNYHQSVESLAPTGPRCDHAGANKSAPLLRFETSQGSAQVFASAREISPAFRAGAFGGHTMDFRYYQITEDSLSGQFDHRYLVLQNTNTGQSAIQPVFLVDQDILDGLPHNLHQVLTLPKTLFPRWLQLRMLVAGCSAGAGALDQTEPWAIAALDEALQFYARRESIAIILLKDFPTKYRDALRPLERGGYRRIPSMPGCALELDFGTFEDYMKNVLGRSLRYKYIRLNKMPPITYEVLTDVTPVADEIHALYKQTYDRAKMRFEYLTPEFFGRIGREMPEKAHFFLWRVNGRIAAFALCLVHAGTIYHLNSGFDYAVSTDLQLYFVTMRDLFQWALDNRLHRYCTGQLNYDPKLHFRMKLEPLDLYARHTSPILNPLFKRALAFLSPVRHEPILRQFANAGDV